MSRAPEEQGGWDAEVEATRAFQLTPDVTAVIFCSDVAVIKKKERGPARRRFDRLLQELEDLLRSGKPEEARAAIDRVAWPGPQMVWWTTTPAELIEVIERHDRVIHARRIAAGVSVEEFTPAVVFFHVWWDR